MGFSFDYTASQSPNTNKFTQSVRGSLVAGATLTGNIPNVVTDGDLLFAFFNCSSGPTTAWTTPSGWTLLIPQKDGSSSFGGRAAIFYKKWSTGDSMTVASASPGGESQVTVLVVKSNTDASSLLIGNPPSSGFVSGYDNEGTSVATSLVFPKAVPDSSSGDLRVYFLVITGSGGTLSPPSVSKNADNTSGQQADIISGAGISGQFSYVALSAWSDPSGADAGTTTWTITGAGGKYYAVSIVIHDPNIVSGQNGTDKTWDPTALEAVVPTPGRGTEYIDTLDAVAVPSVGAGSVELF